MLAIYRLGTTSNPVTRIIKWDFIDSDHEAKTLNYFFDDGFVQTTLVGDRIKVSLNMILNQNLFVTMNFYADAGLFGNTIVGYSITKCIDLILFSWDRGNKFLYSNDNVIRIFPNSTDYSDMKIILYGIWTFPQGDLIQAK